jgi:hypothetical protein
MVRHIGAALVGLAVYFVAHWLGLVIAWGRWGPDFAFRGQTAVVTGGWLLFSLALAVGAAFLGGWVAGSLGGGRPVQLLAGFLLILGMVTVVTGSRRAPVEPPEDLAALSVREALVVAVEPGWAGVLEALLATAGALVGGAGRHARV